MTGEARSTRKSRAPKALAVGGGVLALAAVGYVGACYHYKDTIAEGTTVAGRSIGGMTVEQAKRQVAGIPHPDAAKKATVTAGPASFQVAPASAWRPDADATLDGVTGFGLSPKRLFAHVSGGGEKVTPRFTLDQARLNALVKKSAEAHIEGSPKQGKVKFIGGEVVVVDGQPGHGIDDEAVAKQIGAGWPRTTSFSTKLMAKNPDASNDAVLAFAQNEAKQAMSGPLSVSANGETLELSAAQVSDMISSTSGPDGKPRIALDTKAFLDHVLSHSTDMQKGMATDAKVVWKDDRPSVVDGHPGREIDRSKVEQVVVAALVGGHRAALPMKDMKPQVTAADIDVSKLPSASMATFQSRFPTGPSQKARIHNITTAIKQLNGQIVLPGEQFSLLRALGYDFSEDKGYVEAGTLQGGIHVDGMGGGVSQVSTTVYNTAFFAGVQLDDHTAHAVHIDRYPMGREATIWNPGIDNTWTNDTGHPILIRAHVESNKVVMDFLGTKKYDVSTWRSGKQKIVQPKHRTVKNVKGCENSTGPGTAGFEVDVWRSLKSGGAVVRTEKIHTKYAADDIITCAGKTS